MKKGFMTMLAAGLCLSLLAACGGGSGGKETQAPTELVVETAAETEAVTETEMPTETETERQTETETETKKETETETEKVTETEKPTETEAALEDGEKLLVSEDMHFSFHYDEAHTANVTDAGIAELAIGGDESLVGLSVSVLRADALPALDQLIEENMSSETQKYLNTMAQPPEKKDLEIDGHSLKGYTYSYRGESGETVDCTYYVELREGRGIIYRTEGYSDTEAYQAGQDALEKAVRTLQFTI